ncbi:MAG TPA: bifunctional pyr operon transcriptional regulator/uracil phosphoribosyltransferase PyrR [Polyangium sp.]|nr:bifunctional pyr operon transcriptional regulator/uracil phosphoribosyltransferase PyrR [Polyangium sp.]
MSEVLLDPVAISRGLRRVAGEIAEHGGVRNLALVGIRRGGEPIALRLAALLGELEGEAPPVGAIDITLYRDDAATALPNPKIGPSYIPFSVDGKRILLVDDVISTGRTIRAAVDAVLDYGRPKRIELCVLVDRGGRELPIHPDYTVRRVEVAPGASIDVTLTNDELWAKVVTDSDTGFGAKDAEGDPQPQMFNQEAAR